MSEPICPAGYYPIPGDIESCKSTDQTTIITKLCPIGLVILPNGLCGDKLPTASVNNPPYCGKQYKDKSCKLVQQLVSSNNGGVEEGPNTICAFQENDTQFPCDPGCCVLLVDPQFGIKPETSGNTKKSKVPWWLILGIVFVCICILLVFLWLRIRKHG